jgi:hypothetical protein
LQGRDPRGGGPGRERDSLRYLHLGTQMVLVLLLPLLGGGWLDTRYGTGPVLTLTGAVAGIGMSIWVVMKEAGRARR